ncbi:unnamed protein product, partial [Leptidea sinapis]
MTAGASKQFSRAELAGRCRADDAVFVIDNVVYDVTGFLDDHPGGHEVLLNAAGKDATEEFHDIGHSLDAKELMKKYAVGEVVEAERRQVRDRTFRWEDVSQDAPPGFLDTWKFPLLLGLLMTLLYTFLF